MTDCRLESEHLEPFDVAQIHGFMALRHLATAHEPCMEWERLREVVRSQSEKEFLATAGAELSKKTLLEKEIAHHLFAAVILFQASMESILKMTSEMDSRIESAVDDNKSFEDNWQDALSDVGESTDAFDRYKDEIYDEYRNPLAHCGTDDDIDKINDISFQDVYCGIRCGWWAYDKLLHGIGRTGGDHDRSWELLCKRVGLNPNLYQDDDLVQ